MRKVPWGRGVAQRTKGQSLAVHNSHPAGIGIGYGCMLPFYAVWDDAVEKEVFYFG